MLIGSPKLLLTDNYDPQVSYQLITLST
jgi:hypothetical protein